MQNEIMSTSIPSLNGSSVPLLLADKEHSETDNLRRLQEMARLLEIIRNMQCRLASKFKKSVTRLVCSIASSVVCSSSLQLLSTLALKSYMCFVTGGRFKAIGICGLKIIAG